MASVVFGVKSLSNTGLDLCLVCFPFRLSLSFVCPLTGQGQECLLTTETSWKLVHRRLRPAAATFGPHGSTNTEPLGSKLSRLVLTSDALGSLITCQSVKYLKFIHPVDLPVGEARHRWQEMAAFALHPRPGQADGGLAAALTPLLSASLADPASTVGRSGVAPFSILLVFTTAAKASGLFLQVLKTAPRRG